MSTQLVPKYASVFSSLFVRGQFVRSLGQIEWPGNAITLLSVSVTDVLAFREELIGQPLFTEFGYPC